MKTKCEEYLISTLTEENMSKFHIYMQMADMCNAERLRVYCQWYFRRFIRSQTDLLDLDDDMPQTPTPEVQESEFSQDD